MVRVDLFEQILPEPRKQVGGGMSLSVLWLAYLLKGHIPKPGPKGLEFCFYFAILSVLRSQDKLQSPMGPLTTHKIMTGKNTGGSLPVLRWEAEEKWVGGRLCIGFSCRWWIFRIGNICGWRLLVFYVLSLSKLRDFWVVKTCKYAIHSPCRQCWV